MVSTLAWNARDVGLVPALGTIFPIFITAMNWCCDQDPPVQTTCFTVVEPTLYVYVRSLPVYNCKLCIIVSI